MLCLATILPFLALAENLFDESGFQSYVSDKRAFRAGDALTVIIMENAEAKTESDRNVSREYGVSGGINGSGFNEAGDLAVGVGRQSGDVTQRAGALRAAMTVSVTAINESGNLEVVGSQRIALDGEEQLITVEGSVRPQDISADNT
ncbi:MAG: flagellar basal body L-ring protein FlgH, partial [Haliea sp.]|nr:flagellar basal body L-ring protein FlgH [Haliea sp.]